jgi:hypothetical protein
LLFQVSRIASPTVLNGLGSAYSDHTKNQNSRKNSTRNLTRSHIGRGLRVGRSRPEPAPTVSGAGRPLGSARSGGVGGVVTYRTSWIVHESTMSAIASLWVLT